MWLIRRFLKGGVLESESYWRTTQGPPQGGNLSPLLANIYLHYVLDLWFEKRFKRSVKGYVRLVRYCDDFIILCEKKEESKACLEALRKRLEKFNLELMEKRGSSGLADEHGRITVLVGNDLELSPF